MNFLLLSALFLSAAAAHRESFTIPNTVSGKYNSFQAEDSFSISSAGTPEEVALAHLETLVPGVKLQLHHDTYTDDDTGITHVYFTQTLDGFKVENAVANVNIRSDGSVLSAGTSLIKDISKQVQKRALEEIVEPLDALIAASKAVGYNIGTENAEVAEEDSLVGDQRTVEISNLEGVQDQAKGELVYYAGADGKVKLVWRLETDLDDNYMITYANAHNPSEVLAAVDWVADASYNVYPLGVNDPTDGSRKVLTDPHNTVASPNGWHTKDSTYGNNGIAQENFDGGSDFLNNQRPAGTSARAFNFPYSLTTTTPATYINAAVTQLFYTSNMYHDLLEVLGFTEQAGNFEEVNTSGLGKGNDAVQLNAQDGTGYNNANFLTPADGSRPRMRMYVWNVGSGIQRDGDFEAGIVIHEYTHGLSNRLTGGPASASCLSTTEAGGLGEGWGDWYATAIRLKANDTRATDYGMGDWANGGTGIRNYPYSTSMTTNPLTYTNVGKSGYTSVHPIGSIWAEMLYEVLWNLEEKWGYQSEVFPVFRAGTAIPTKGRQLAMKLVLEAMKLQPCNPTFVAARNAIIDADEAITGGENFCEIWKGFAKRGLGSNASGTGASRVNGFAVPASCSTTKRSVGRYDARAKN